MRAIIYHSKGKIQGGGRNPQNLKIRERFCKELKGWRGVRGVAPAKFLDFDALLSVFTSFYVNICDLK